MRPQTETELAEVIRTAPGPLAIRGGGTRPIGVPRAGDALSVAGLTGVSLYEPGALTLVVKAGTTLAEVEAVLAEENQRLPFEPMDHRALLATDGAPTIGGVVAANVSGPRRVQAGACRDSMIGVRYVDGMGNIIKNGGRVMKNVTGYDLVKLMAGSYGTLGVLTEVAFKVLPAPGATATIRADGLDEATAVRAMSAALGSPFEVNGAAHHSDRHADHSKTLLRIEGFSESVAYRANALSDLLKPYGDWQLADADWSSIRDVAPFVGQPGDVWRLSIKPSDAPGLVAQAAPLDALFDWGGGLVWLRVSEGTDLRADLGSFSGHATLIRAADEIKTRLGVFHPEPAPLAKISTGLRAKFDPRGILNPGLMG
ncbi:FAD-binding protein [Primorskyibacter flagellatus]|uniref:FAD-binding protein n=1 Tax=Primorskyibacter flagellatus TaxID=1387277 RepID=UPI003A8DEBE6